LAPPRWPVLQAPLAAPADLAALGAELGGEEFDSIDVNALKLGHFVALKLGHPG